MDKNIFRRAGLLLVLCLALVTSAYAAGEPPLAVTGGVTVQPNVDAALPWKYDAAYSDATHVAYIAGNSGSNAANVSNIALKVTEPGVLSFDYCISATGTGDGGDNYALYYSKNTPMTLANKIEALNYAQRTQFQGVQPWTRHEVTITQADIVSGNATLYIAFYRGGTFTYKDNKVAIANVGFVSGMKTLTLEVTTGNDGVTGGPYGTVTGASMGANPVVSGTALTLTAAPTAGNRFYGWLDGRGDFLSSNSRYDLTVASNTGVKAVFAPADSYAVRRNGQFYTAAEGGLSEALAKAQPMDSLMLLSDQTLMKDATLPAGATLYIPYDSGYDADGSADGTVLAGGANPYPASLKVAGDDQVYCTLTINPNVTLTANGSITVGSVISYPSNGGYSGHTSGVHGKIVNNGAIIVGSGAKLDSWGIVSGSGTVTARAGAKIYEPFIVVDFVGGSNTGALYGAGQSPFRHWAVQNVQSTLVLEPGAELLVHCNLFALSAYHKTDIQFFSSIGLFQLEPTTSVTRTYDGTKHTTLNPDLGLTTYTVSGGMRFSALNLVVEGISAATDQVDFPVPYNIRFCLENGNYTVPRRIKIMPGTRFTVADGATLAVLGDPFPVGKDDLGNDITKQPALFVHNGLKQSDMSGKVYPSGEVLKAAGFSQSGELIVDGTLLVKTGATLGGIIQTGGGTGIVTIEPGTTLETPRLQDGAKGSYDNNLSICASIARANIGGALTPLAVGSYHATGAAAFTLPSYDVKYMVTATKAEHDAYIATNPPADDVENNAYVDKIETNTFHKWKNETVKIDQAMTGTWAAGKPSAYAVTVKNKTVYAEGDSTRTTVTGATVKADKTIQFQVTKTAEGKGYVWLVEYQKAGQSTPTKLTAAASGDYTISGVDANVTITVTAVKLGDVNLDGKITATDALFILKIANGSLAANEFQQLVANANGDAKITATDALYALKIANGSYNPN